MIILGPLLKTSQSIQFILVIMERYTKLTKAILTTKSNASTDACIILKKCLKNYGIPTKLITDSGPQLVSKFFVSVYFTPRIDGITTSRYCLLTSCQVERFNTSPTMQRCHYISEHQIDWAPKLVILSVHLHRTGVQVSQSVHF